MCATIPDKELLARLLSFESISEHGNREIADYVCEYLECAGAQICPIIHDDPERRNVVAWVGPDLRANHDRRGLMLCGHLDVVPAGQRGWNSPPFEMTVNDGTIVARGACDMKGFDALAIGLIAAHARENLEHPLAILLTHDEEVGSLGAKDFVERWPQDHYLPRNVIIGEPTSLRAIRMHKGHIKVRVTVHGKSAHSGSPHLGRSAIESAARIINGLARLRQELTRQRCETSRYFATTPFTVLNVGRVQGGDAINVVPDQCTIELGIRPLPGMTSDAAISWVRDVVRKSETQGNFDFEIINDNPPMLLDQRAEVYKELSQLLDQSQSFGVSFSSDAGHLCKAGYDCVLFGPGTIEVAHRPNEFVPIDELIRAREIISQMIVCFCY